MKKTVCGIAAILMVAFMMLHPLSFIGFVFKGLHFAIVWAVCSGICRLVFHRSLTDLIFGGDK